MITATLQEILDMVIYGGDIGGTTTGDDPRHPVANITAEINLAYSQHIDFILSKGFDYFIEETALANLPTSRADTNEDYSLIDYPLNVHKLLRLDVFAASGNIKRKLTEISWQQVRDIHVQVYNYVSDQCPRYFAVKSIGTVSGITATAGKIALCPFGSAGQYKMSYVPKHVPITTTTHLFRFANAASIAWVVNTVILVLAKRDRNFQARAEEARNALARAISEIGQFVPGVISTGTKTVTRSKQYWST